VIPPFVHSFHNWLLKLKFNYLIFLRFILKQKGAFFIF
jgi:hypothetical protein